MRPISRSLPRECRPADVRVACVPGVAPDDWQPEPSPLAEMNPGSGEIIWSTLFPSEVADEILDQDGDD